MNKRTTVQGRLASTLMTSVALVGAYAFPALAPAPAAAQQAPPAEAVDTAEAAFLLAYYQEKGLHDFAAAEKAYAEVIAQHTNDKDIRRKALLGRFRCLVELGRTDDSASVRRALESEFGSNASVAAELTQIDARATSDNGHALEDRIDNLVAGALVRNDSDWTERVVQFGAPAVPTLVRALRNPDPEIAKRASIGLVRIATDGAIDALAAALQDPSIIYADQIWIGMGSGCGHAIPQRLGAAILVMPDAELRDRLLLRVAGYTAPNPWLASAARDRAHVRELLLQPGESRGTRALIAVTLLGSGPGAARDDAVAYVESFEGVPLNSMDWRAAFFPPPAFCADAEAVRLLARVVYPRLLEFQPSSRLIVACWSDPTLRELSLRWFWRGQRPDDLADRPDELVDRLVGGPWYVPGRLSFHTPLIELLKHHWTPARVDLLVRAWPKTDEYDLRRFEGLTSHLLERDPLDPELVRALLDAAEPTEQHELVLKYLAGYYNRLGQPEWATRLLAAELPAIRDAKTRVDVADALDDWAKESSQDLPPYIAALASMVHDPDIGKYMVRVFLHSGPRGLDTLANELRVDSPTYATVLEALVRVQHEGVRATLRDVVLAAPGDGTRSDREIRRLSVGALARLAQDDALETFKSALRLEDGRYAAEVLAYACASDINGGMSREAYTALLLDAIEITPEPFAESLSLSSVNGKISTGPSRARLVIRAIGSPVRATRIWGLRDAAAKFEVAYLEPLLPCLEDADETIRHAARDALLSYRRVEQEAQWLKSIALRDRNVARVEELLASANRRHRLAGIAGLVGLGGADVASRLLELAATDADDEVAAEARRALMALPQPRNPEVVVQPSETK